MEIKATTPCYKFRDVKPEEQIAKLKEELAEVEEAYQRLKQNPNEYQKLVDLHQLFDSNITKDDYYEQDG